MHYLAIFASFMDVKGNLQIVLLSMAPLMEGDDIQATNFRAEDHIVHIRSVLKDFYGKSVNKNVVYLGGDNCSVNRKLAAQMEKPLVGCGSHRHALEMKRYVKEHPALKAAIQTCHKVMKKSKTLKVAAELRNVTRLRPKLFNKTRWRGQATTVKRYLELEKKTEGY
jgi:hypothetical protein